MRYTSQAIVKSVYAKRKPWSHKGQFGRLVVVSGSWIHTGSPIFVGMSAYRAGCDLVFVTGPERAMNMTANYSPSLITKPLKGDYLEEKHVDQILTLVETSRATAGVIGPGLWRIDKTRKAMNRLIEKINVPMVVDADAVRSSSSIKNKLKDKKILFTPHADEFFEFTGTKLSENLKDRISFIQKESLNLNCGESGVCPINPPMSILVKGNVDIVSNGKDTMLNETGNPFMTKGGFGDTLTGIAGALLARGIDIFKSGCAAAFINGKAGDMASKDYGEGTLPTDLIEKIPSIIKPS